MQRKPLEASKATQSKANHQLSAASATTTKSRSEFAPRGMHWLASSRDRKRERERERLGNERERDLFVCEWIIDRETTRKQEKSIRKFGKFKESKSLNRQFGWNISLNISNRAMKSQIVKEASLYSRQINKKRSQKGRYNEIYEHISKINSSKK